MDNKYLVYDVHNMAWRAFYAVGGLSYHGTPTGVYFNILGQILQHQGLFGTEKCVFCFDSRKSLRKKIDPEYKRSRHENNNPENQEAIWELIGQIKGLRTKYLYEIGFRNIFRRTGFEADDLIAKFCKDLPKGDSAVVISTDSDLLQLISKRVHVYDPRKKFLWDLKRFREQTGLQAPRQWAEMKSIAGCPTDGVKGIMGIGEKTAIKFLRMQLPVQSKKYLSIMSAEGQAIRKKNFPLVELPFEGTPPLKIRRDETLDWKPVLASLGIKSLSTELVYKEKPK